MLAATALVALALAAAAPAAPALVTAREPEAVRALFARWGYQPDAIEAHEGVPHFAMTVDGIRTGVGFGGCTDNRNCAYVVFVTTFEDVGNPPLEWINARNNDYDLVTLSRGDTGKLEVQGGIMLGTQGVPEALLRDAVSSWAAMAQEAAREAIAAHLVTAP